MACRIEPHCNACGLCIAICPVWAIAELPAGVRIEPLLCTECLGYAEAPVCIEVCPCHAISVMDMLTLPPVGGQTGAIQGATKGLMQ
ncbi:MAG: hypothetical protein KIT83_16290 [Bryobacterales bacterium]|nr:hypothetical protein [Bryobacterales bacterium]